MNRQRRRLLSHLLLGVGLINLVFAGWALAQYRIVTTQRPYFWDPHGIAVAPDGTIFVGVNASEVHAYGSDGTPLRGWRVPSQGNVFRLRLASPERLEIAPARTGRLLGYDLHGQFQDEHGDTAAFARFGAENDNRFVSASGAVFELNENGLVRTSPAPTRVLVPSPPWPLAALGSQPILPLFLLLSSGCVVLICGIVLTSTPRRDA